MDYTPKNIYGKTRTNPVTVSVPGSKSITARAILLAALSGGESTLYGAQFSDDCQTFLNCIKSLGIPCETQNGVLKITGCGGKLGVTNAKINVGSAGTAARFLPAMLAFQNGTFTVDCSEQMKRRPIAPLITALKDLGAKFEFLGTENCFPFKITGTANPAKAVTVNVNESSQFLSALLISAVCAKNGVSVTAEGTHGLDYISMTLDMMWSFGVTVNQQNNIYNVKGKYSAKKYDIEPDLSAACYFYAINKILGTNISVNGVMPHSMQGDYKFIAMLKDFDGGKVDMSAFSDQALTLAAIAPYLKNPTHICNVAHIRKQECDRISAIVENLTAMGVKTEEYPDGVKIYPAAPQSCKINTFGDHRVAMSFALTGFRADGITVQNAEVCSKTFKDYFAVLDEVTQKLL